MNFMLAPKNQKQKVIFSIFKCSKNNNMSIDVNFLKIKTHLVFIVIASFFVGTSSDAQISNAQLAGLKYRMIGPHRAGRTVGISGVADQPNVFYIGVNNGGVWKTTDYGHTWKQIGRAHV